MIDTPGCVENADSAFLPVLWLLGQQPTERVARIKERRAFDPVAVSSACGITSECGELAAANEARRLLDELN